MSLLRTLRVRLSQVLLLTAVLSPAAWAAPATAQDDERLSADDLEFVALDLRRGRVRQVDADLEEIREELPADFLATALHARTRFELCAYEDALALGREALEVALRSADATPTSGPSSRSSEARLGSR